MKIKETAERFKKIVIIVLLLAITKDTHLYYFQKILVLEKVFRICLYMNNVRD